jgi:general secretion pathway protein A
MANDIMDAVKQMGQTWREKASWLLYVLCIIGISSLPWFVMAADNTESDIRDTARLLAILLDSGRVTVGRNQDLINDPSNPESRFTAQLFTDQTIALFKQRTGHSLTDLPNGTIPMMARPLLEQLLEQSKKTVESFQPVLHMKGLKYKGLIPATFGTETARRFQKTSGIYLKQTAPEYLLRNPNNKPDAFEAEQMKRLSDPSFQHDGETVLSDIQGAGSVRVMLPLFYEKSCLICHGEPKGERDISGYPKDGGRLGELAGAISVKIEQNDITRRAP